MLINIYNYAMMNYSKVNHDNSLTADRVYFTKRYKYTLTVSLTTRRFDDLKTYLDVHI